MKRLSRFYKHLEEFALSKRRPLPLVNWGRVPALASLWDHIENPGERSAIIIKIEGHRESLIARPLAARLTERYPDAVIASVGKGSMAERYHTNGSLVPASPNRLRCDALLLAPDRSEDDIRPGYDIVVWRGSIENPDIEIKLHPNSWEVKSKEGVRTSSPSKHLNFLYLDPTGYDSEIQMAHGAPQEDLPKALDELDALINTLGIPSNLGSGALSLTRPVRPVRNPSEEERFMADKLFDFITPWREIIRRSTPGVHEQFAGLLREKMSPEGIENLYVLLKDSDDAFDFFDLARVANVL